MAPPCRVFPASQLPAEIQVDDGKRRKGTAGSGRIDLEACELLAMLQYDCLIDKAPGERESTVKCLPVQRWFRRYVSFSFALPLSLRLSLVSSIFLICRFACGVGVMRLTPG